MSQLKEEIEENDMSTTRELIDAIYAGNSQEIERTFDQAMASRIVDVLDARRLDIAQNMFRVEEEVNLNEEDDEVELDDEVEQIDEISKRTMLDFHQGAHKNIDDLQRQATRLQVRAKTAKTHADQWARDAKDPSIKFEAEPDFANKKAQQRANDAEAFGKTADHMKKKIDKRREGIQRAADRLTA